MLASLRPRLALVLVCVAILALIRGPDGGGSIPDSGPVSTVAATAIDEGYGSHSPIVSLAELQRIYPGAKVSAVGMRFDGIARAYLVIAPAWQRGPLPLIVELAGSSASPAFEASRDDLGQLASTGKAVLVFPSQYEDSWNVEAKGCCAGAAEAGIDDVGFVAAVVARVEATGSVTSRAHLVGYSNGGKLGFTIVCQRPRLFESYTAVAAVPLQACASSDQPPVSTQFVIGGKDPELPITGAAVPALTALASALATWRARDGCTDQFRVALAGPAKVTTWTTCAGGAAVQSAVNLAVAHQWPTVAEVGRSASALQSLSDFLGL